MGTIIVINKIAHWKPRPIAENKIFVAAIAIAGVGAAQGILNSFDVFGSKAMTEILAFLACAWLLPNEPRRKWSLGLCTGLIGTGLLLGAIWVLFIGFPGRHETNFPQLKEIPLRFYALGLVTSCIAAPLFEEKVVRHLLLEGGSHYFGKLTATIGASALFAAVHVDAVVPAFLLSVLLCIGAQRFNLNSAQRSVIHGLINFSILHWVIFYPTLRDFLQPILGSSL
jgi:membrane protease YdiL (CAAX protease family)